MAEPGNRPDLERSLALGIVGVWPAERLLIVMLNLCWIFLKNGS